MINVPSPYSVAATIVLLLAAFISSLAIRSLVHRYATDVHYVPKPPGGSWIWGHELEPLSGNCGAVYSSWFDKYGPVVRIGGALGHNDILVVADPVAISHILTKNVYRYVKSSIMRPVIERTIGRGLVWAEGDEHRRMRALLANVFTAEKTRNMHEDVKICADRVVAKLINHLRAHDGDTTVHMTEWVSRATLDIIGRIVCNMIMSRFTALINFSTIVRGFAHDFGCGESPEAQKLASWWDKTINLSMTRAARIAPIVIRTLPFIISLPIPALRAQSTVKLIVKRLAEDLYANASANPELSKGKDLLSTLVRANSRERRSISKDELLDHICTFVVVGHDTTSGALGHTIRALAQNPDVQDKLRKELLDFGAEPTYDDILTRLPYLDAVTKEGLRMFPPTAHTERIALHDDVIPLRKPIITPEGKTVTSLHIKKGQLIQIPSLAVDKMHAVWGDGDTFRPERWLNPGELPSPSELTQGWSNLFVFSEGPRMCIGYRLALLEFKVILSSFVKAFVLHDTGAEIEYIWAVTLQPKVAGEEGLNLPVRITLADH
ncbi:hypothetical protein BOTBODRAFT_190763 [Botryobasidium botryosum FD-172 SS1]|uniref:Cytochrome P450 n=1 Tax=Botryobasidium botryosum (strain FD-172 SS1) TaxID=930990 RepID=A0A067MDM6_BOTB1|nr:hypothetical protein BOTBODRAFT_190763 [Botryobasidium botryosum FD-172 SS1]